MMNKLSKISQFKRHLTENIFSSVKSLIVWVFIPIVAIIIFIVSGFAYGLLHQQLEAHAYINIADTVSQTKNYLDNRLYDIFEQLVVLNEDSDVLSVISRVGNDQKWRLRDFDYIQVSENINKVYTSYYSSIKSILFDVNDERVLFYKTDNFFSGINFSFSSWRKRFHGNPSGYYWLNLHQDQVFIGETDRVVSLFKLIGREDSSAHGIILFNLRERFFRKIIENPVISPNGYMALVSDDGVLAFKTVDRRFRLNREILNKIRNLSEKSGILKYQTPFGPKMAIIYNTVSACHWKLVAVLPENEIISKGDYIKPLLVLLVIILVIVAGVMFNVLATMITKPLTQLTKKVQCVTDGNMDVPFNITVANEIGVLNKGIGALIAQIKTLFRQVKEEQEKKRQADLAVLQAQINPHFLYNTIYSIQQLCELGENENASKMLLALANFFRIGLSQGQDIITIREEIDHVRNYLVIQHMKYADQLQFEVNIEPSILEEKIIKLTLQPIVENAIYHGVKQRSDQGVIHIKGYRDGDSIRIIIEDNGVGMDENQLDEIRKYLAGNCERTGSFGIRNVNERLKIHFGPDCGLAIDSQKNLGTRVTVLIPVTPQNKIIG